MLEKESPNNMDVAPAQPIVGPTVAAVEQKPVAEKIKTVSSRKLLVGALGVVLLGGLIGFLTCYVAMANSGGSFEEKLSKVVEEAKDTEGADSPEVAEVKDDKTGETVKVIKVPVGNSQEDVAVREIAEKLFKVAVNEIYGGADWHPQLVHTYNENSVLYRPDGLKTDVPLILSYGFKFAWDNGLSTQGVNAKTVLEGGLQKALAQELERNGFKKYQDFLTSEEYINEQAGIVCALNWPGWPYGAECGSVNWYGATDDWDLLNGLAEAYRNKNGEYPIYLRVNSADIRNTGYKQYQTLTVGIANAMGKFYRVNPDSEWVFLYGGHVAPDCSVFNTEDLKQAFAGVPCE